LLAADLRLIAGPQYAVLAAEISQIKRMLGALARKLKADR
jgi:hypothetical protein